MDGNPTQPRKAQLDKEEREHLEDVVTEMRDRVEANVRYQLENEYNLNEKPDADASLSEKQEDLIEAIELEIADEDNWEAAHEQYITGVGYTIVNRLAALRCMEVRDFINDEVTRFREDGLTPAADQLVTEEFMIEEEAVLEAYLNACDDLAEEIEILFDRSTSYSQIDPDEDTFEDLCEMLDEVPNEVWRADDVLGWVYEYYNVKLLDDLRRKGDREGLEPEDVPAANQFYTPHWVVRMLTDNSLGKLYLEDQGELQDAVERQESLTPDERKNRPLSPDASPDIADFCTYLVPSKEEGKPSEFDSPKDIRVIDPACGSGHFLLYAFDVLERIYRSETEIDNAKIPREILRNNLYGIDLDMRACQLAAFNLYLKGRTRTEAEGGSGFDMPEIGIVCADTKVVNVEGVEQVFTEVAKGDENVKQVLSQILDSFEKIDGLGSLLDVRGTLNDLFEDDIDEETVQITLSDNPRKNHTLGQTLHNLREVINQHRSNQSLLAQQLRSFIHLLEVLTNEYDVALMNPPYGSRKRMPDNVQAYIEDTYDYYPEYYITFVEQCRYLTKSKGRIGMLIPRSFMFKKSFKQFREDFINKLGSFEFLSEFGLGVLDNATVRTAGTILKTGDVSPNSTGSFFRLHDLPTNKKESVFTQVLCDNYKGEITRQYDISLSNLNSVPGTPISYYVPEQIRTLHETNLKLDADTAQISGKNASTIATGLQTGDNDRFLRRHWETAGLDWFKPYAKGGSDAWIAPTVQMMVDWRNGGNVLRRAEWSVLRNEQYYGQDGLTWTYIKDTGRRFGYLPTGSRFDVAGSMLFPKTDSPWSFIAILNSKIYHMLMLSITPERQWNQGDVGRLPWLNQIDPEPLENLCKEQYELALKKKFIQPTSPYYLGPSLLPLSTEKGFFYNVHPYTEQSSITPTPINEIKASEKFSKSAQVAAKEYDELNQLLEQRAEEIDSHIYASLGIDESTKDAVLQEIQLRTTNSDQSNESDTVEIVQPQIKRLVHHFAMEAVREKSDGIIPLEGADEQDDMHDRIIKRFNDVYGEYAENRIAEVDEILGTESAVDEAYPNLRSFIEEDLFAYHVNTMENTPIIWKISTERLLADAKGEGFACFVDYQQLDASLFDRLSNQYLEPRKAELRERRSAANQQRNDESLSTSERAEATDEFEFCSSALEQVSEIEEVMQKLGSTSKREFNTTKRECASDLAPKVAAFREETAERIETLDQLREINGEKWFQDTFSDGFFDKVNQWRNEWLDALEELERACEEYAKPNYEPVEAHLADLFNYFRGRLKGSDHFSSTGILFMTYYFEREGSELLNDAGEPFDNLTEDEKMLASLATGIDDESIISKEYLKEIAEGKDIDDIAKLPPIAEFKALAEEIEDGCQTIDDEIPSDWSDRALSEITTAGYQPNRKHGVAINITPLAEKDIVPEIVEDKVL